MTCTCIRYAVTNDIVADEPLCDFCSEMLYAAERDARMATLLARMNEMESNDFVTGDGLRAELDEMIERALSDSDIPSKDDLSDYVAQEDLESEVEDIVKHMDHIPDPDDFVAESEFDERVETIVDRSDLAEEVAKLLTRLEQADLRIAALESPSFVKRVASSLLDLLK